MATGDMTTICTRKHPVISDSREEMKQRALLVALGLVYFMRLNSKYRKKFTEEMSKLTFVIDFQTAFTQEVNIYVLVTM